MTINDIINNYFTPEVNGNTKFETGDLNAIYDALLVILADLKTKANFLNNITHNSLNNRLDTANSINDNNHTINAVLVNIGGANTNLTDGETAMQTAVKAKVIP